MSEDTSKMEVESPQTADISSLKEAAKEIMEASENKSNNGEKQNGSLLNGDSAVCNGNGNEDSSSPAEEEMEVEDPQENSENQNGDKIHSDKDTEADNEVEAINSGPPSVADSSEESVRRTSRQKTPTKFSDEYKDNDSSEEEIEEVEEIKDDDSDIQEVEAEDPLGGDGSVTITPKNSQKKPNVVTIDDLKTLQKLATSAKQSKDKEKADSRGVLDTQSIIAGKMGSGVSITPAKPKTGAVASSGLNISSAGLTLGSGVTIRPNKPSVPANNTGVSITPVEKNNTATSSTASASASSTSQSSTVDPNLTDDTFVVEAPSFIVPYVYEKPPKEAIRDFKESVDEIVEKKKKEKEKRKAAGEEVSDDEDEKKKKKGEDDDDEDEDKAEKSEKEEKDKEAKKEKKEEHKDAYFNSKLGKFFTDLGMNLVQEYVQTDLLRDQQRRSIKDKSVAVIHAIKSLESNLEESKDKNEGFHHDLRKCRFCSFRTESRLVLQHHMETPHMRNFVYRCNFCDFETKIPQEVLFHMDNEHGVKGKLERAPYYHQCPNCPFEDNGKGKLTRHKVGCDKRFKAEDNQKPERDWDPPAKIRPPPVRSGGYPGYMNFKHGQQIRPGSSLMPKQNFNANRFGAGANRGVSQQNNINKMKGMTPQMLASQQMLAVLNQQGLSVSGVKGLNNMMLGNNVGKSGSVTIQSLGQKGGSKNNSPSISITPLPGRNNPGQKKTNSASPSSSSNAIGKPGQPGQGQGGKGNFVICEICDGYIKDLEQLRNHMQWIHKVKIHPKMIYNRPPLNCQKCQFRFFTDQGLERHLLGSHGLVTASMQDAANKGQDSGRCPVCGKVYQWKLLNHVAKDHGKTLKPAHLSYKCTVCTATFGQYKLFENHVYTAHSGVAKKADKNKQAAKTGGSVLKSAVKLSDEISIIPTKKDNKGADKNKEIIDLDDEEEIDDVEKEVIDIDAPKKRAGENTGQPEAKKVKVDAD